MEAFIVAASASLFGLILAELLLPTFNSLTSQNLTLQPYLSLIGLAGLLVFVMLIGFLAGSYPSFYLSQLQAVECLQSNRLPLGKGRATRILVTLQYAVSIFLICCTVLMLRQLHFLVNTDIGFKRENIVVVPIRGSIFINRNAEEANRQRDLLKTELHRDPRIEYVIATSSPATRGGAFMGIRNPDGEIRMFAARMVDPGYLDAFGLELVEGRFFDDSMGPVNTSSVVVSESFVRLYDLETPVVGQSIPNLLGTDTNPSIIGVVRDFHVRSLHREVDPVLLHMNPERNFGASQLLIKIRPDDRAGAIRTIESVWQRFNPDTPFEYSFLDEDMENVYASEARWGAIVTDSSVFAILIACLGLFGLASLAVTRRTKEIGIRKVVGASVAQIVGMLSKEFLVLVLIANVIAWPLAWYAMTRWLQNFAYRIDLSWWIFVLVGLLALVIALATVSWQAIRAATANPVESLRYE